MSRAIRVMSVIVCSMLCSSLAFAQGGMPKFDDFFVQAIAERIEVTISYRVDKEVYYYGDEDEKWDAVYDDWSEDEPLPDSIYPYFHDIRFTKGIKAKTKEVEVKRKYGSKEELAGTIITDLDVYKFCRRQESEVLKKVINKLKADSSYEGSNRSLWNNYVLQHDVCKTLKKEDMVITSKTRLKIDAKDVSKLKDKGLLVTIPPQKNPPVYTRSGNEITINGVIHGKIYGMHIPAPPEKPKEEDDDD